MRDMLNLCAYSVAIMGDYDELMPDGSA